MRALILAVLGGTLLLTTSPAGAQRPRSLQAGFTQPPQQAKPTAYWLWLNGYVNRDYFDTELQAFAEKGIGGLCIFDMGARGDARFFPPTGPAFMGEESIESIATALQVARQHGLRVQLAPCSSWDLGGSWVQPRHASMALYRSQIRVAGPQQLDQSFPFPDLPAGVPLDDNSQPAYWQDVAVLAVPESDRLEGHEFIFRLPRGDRHRINRVVLYNSPDDPEPFYAKDFAVAVSAGGAQRTDFQTILTGTLKPHSEAQTFSFPETRARFVRLTVFSGYDTKSQTVQLAEFEIYSTAGVNIGGSKSISYTRDSAELTWASSEAAKGGNFTAANLHDGAKSRPDGIWRFTGPPPLIIRDKADIRNVTRNLDGRGHFRWTVPKGRWTLMRFVCGNTGEKLKVPSPSSDGLATDHFNAEATRTFLETVIRRLEHRVGNLREAGISELYLPSYEVVGAKWTPDFLDQFQRYRHYDMTPFLPVFTGCIIEDDEQTRRFLYDFEKTLGQLLVDAYYRTASETARQAGLGIEAEAGGPGPPVHQVPVDALQALGAIDEMRGEFWPWRPERNGLWVVKETACAAHVYGHRRVHMESFTGFHHWTNGPFFLKGAADRAFCEGMNHVVWHTASHQPPEAGQPGWVYGAGTHLTPNLIWWPMAKPFLDYLARCSYMLQQGLFVGDVCYYYGDQGSNFVPPKHVDPSLGPGYDYDVANPEVVLQRMSVRNGRITLPDGMQYEVLVLPDRPDIDLDVLRKLDQLIREGATVVGPKPMQSSGLTGYPNRDQQVRDLADQLWGDCDGRRVMHHAVGRGQVIWGPDLRDILKTRHVPPDFQFTGHSGSEQLDYIHRRTATADIYFVRNVNAEPVEVRAAFRVRDRLPEFWSPTSGEMRICHVFEQSDDFVQLPLSLPGSGSLFVVFRDRDARTHLTAADRAVDVLDVSKSAVRVRASQNGSYRLITGDGRPLEATVQGLPEPIELRGPWHLQFLSGRGAPASLTVPQLTSWTTFPQQSIKHYAGIVRYKAAMEIPDSWLDSSRGVTLDLGHLWAVAQVRVNDQEPAILWQPPFRCDITEYLRPGHNALAIDVANTWSNRLVGDALLPEDQRIARTNVTRSGTPGKLWKDVPLHESGLLGPVRCIATRQMTVPWRSKGPSP